LRKWLPRLLLGLLLGLLGFVFGFLPYFLAGVFTIRTFQMKDAENQGLTPASLGLPSEDVTFKARDGIPLSGWWVPAPGAKGTVVLVHGLNRSRLEMVKKAPFLNRLGWNALLFDLRRHGESGGTVRSLGYHERNDVLGAADFAHSRFPGPVVAWGISFGGAAATLAAAEDAQIAGLVCDSSFRSPRDTARHHLALFRRMAADELRRPKNGEPPSSLSRRLLFRSLLLVPPWPTSDLAVFWMGWRAGFDPDALDVVKAASKLGSRPALFVAGTHDERMPPEIASDLAKAAGPSAKTLVITSEGHGHAYRDGTAAYEAAVTSLLESVTSFSKGELR
jgi:pimeloyl-ACP methyl ester carboxylesterase